MMRSMTRRLLLAGAMLLCSATTSVHAQSEGRRVDVVKIMSFSCEVCFAAESQDRAIEKAVKDGGGKFVWAPVPTVADDHGAVQRLYYAARDMDPAMGTAVKASLYKGIQDRGLTLNDFSQAYAWLSEDLTEYRPRLDALFAKAQAPESEQAVGRAIRLAINANIAYTPSYIILVNNQIDIMLDPTMAKGDSLGGLRDEVISRVQSLNTPKKQ